MLLLLNLEEELLEEALDPVAMELHSQQIALNVTVGECAALARWAGIESVDNFRADVSLSRRGASQFRYDATFEANVTQSCVVTLEPVPAKVSGAFQRDYVLADHRPRGRRGPATAENFAPADSADDVPETLDQPVLDLASVPNKAWFSPWR